MRDHQSAPAGLLRRMQKAFYRTFLNCFHHPRYNTPMERFAATPQPPYYAVIFTAQRTSVEAGYEATAGGMAALAQQMPGYLGIESTRDGEGLGITVSYWASEEAIANWKRHADHQDAQNQGKQRWYEHYEIRVAKVERAYSGPAGR